MKMFLDVPKVYLHKQPVDFRKSINGLSLLVEQEMQLSPFSGALFVFCNQQRTRLKVLYWDRTGFCLWYKRLEKDKFRWPRQMPGKILSISEQQWHWLFKPATMVFALICIASCASHASKTMQNLPQKHVYLLLTAIVFSIFNLAMGLRPDWQFQ